jgi:hypothetical protein
MSMLDYHHVSQNFVDKRTSSSSKQPLAIALENHVSCSKRIWRGLFSCGISEFLGLIGSQAVAECGESFALAAQARKKLLVGLSTTTLGTLTQHVERVLSFDRIRTILSLRSLMHNLAATVVDA